MIKQMAYVTFENELTHSWSDWFKKDNIIPICLDNFRIDDWQTTKKKFDFEEGFTTWKCEILGDELFRLIEHTLEEANERIENEYRETYKSLRKYIDYDENKVKFDDYDITDYKISLFYNELKINNIKKVQLRLKDMS